jgi:hypothetical protein
MFGIGFNEPESAPAAPTGKLGLDHGKFHIPDDFDDPLPDDVLDTFE